MNYRLISPRELFKELDSHKYKELHIHHSIKPDFSHFNGENHVELQINIAEYHVYGLLLEDIGNHISVFPDGKIVTGRDFDKNPISINYHDDGAFSIVLIGNFDEGHDTLAGSQLDSLTRICTYFAYRFGINCIKFHNEIPDENTTCPGNTISKEELIQNVRKALKRDYPIKGAVFNDIGKEMLCYESVNNLSLFGILKESDGPNFNPDEYVTKRELAEILNRFLLKVNKYYLGK